MQDMVMLVPLGFLGVLLLVAIGVVVYAQIASYFERRKIERIIERELARVRQEDLRAWLRERGGIK